VSRPETQVDAPQTEEEYRAAWLATMARHWHVIARSTDVAPGAVIPIRLLATDLTLWRTSDGGLGLVDQRCPHRGVSLSLGSVADDGCIVCPYHAWRFDRAGACADIPQLGGTRILAGASTPAFAVREQHGLVWACLADRPARPTPPPFPELEAGTHWFWMGEAFDWRAQNLRQIENFCDVSHFSVLHADTFGNPAEVASEPSSPTRDGWQLRYRFEYEGMDPTVPATTERTPFPITFDYLIELPCTVLLGGASGPGSMMFVHPCPVDVYETRLFWGTAFPHGVTIDDAQYTDVEERIFHPDLAIVESQRPRGLPVDVLPELHLPHDRCSVAYRRALAELGVPAPPATPARTSLLRTTPDRRATPAAPHTEEPTHA